MRRLGKKEQLLLYAVLGAGILFLADILLFSPLSKRLRALDSQIAKREITLRKALSLENRKEDILKEYKNIGEYLKLRGSDEEVIASFLKEIEAVARQSGVSIIDLKPEVQRKSKGEYSAYLINLHSEGTSEEIADFIYRVETGKFLLKVIRVLLSPKEEGSSLLKADMRINGIVIR